MRAESTKPVQLVLPGNNTLKHTYDWRYILEIAREHKREIIFANIIAIIATICSLPLPLLMPLLVDEVLLDKPGIVVNTLNFITPIEIHGPVFYILAILFITMTLRFFSLLMNVWQAEQFTIISKDVIYRIRCALLQRLERVSMSEYETIGSGTVASYFIKDLDTVDQFVGTTVSRLLIAILTIFSISIVLLIMHWQLALLIFLANPVVIYFTKIMGRHIKDLKREENNAFAVFQQALTETLESIHQIRASNSDRHYIMQIMDYARDVKNNGITYAWKNDVANRLSLVIVMFGFDIFRAVAMMMVILSGLSIGMMFAIFGYLWFLINPVQEVFNIQYAYFSANAALERINRLNQLNMEPEYIHQLDPFKGKSTVGIKIRDLRFSYGNSPDVLNGINLEIQSGAKVALVGASGGGKSTLVQVLIGLYQATSGKVYYGNVPIDKIGLDVVRKNVATVLQNPVLFNDSIRSNVSLGQETTDKKIWEALEICQLKDDIYKMPAGLDTIVGRQGIKLSGGQRQRIAIARVLLTDPKVVILDEATSALDAETEYQLQTAMADFLKDRTTLILAHRLSAIKQADHVYVFESGLISEEGSHEELLMQDGIYAKLYGKRQSFG